MIRVICNASPIIGLIGIGKLNLLWEMFDEVLIPEAVYAELKLDPRGNSFPEIADAIENKCIKVLSIRGSEVVSQLYGKLHLGELETIIGAKEDEEISFAIIDERSARAFASTMLVDTLGILGVLVYAKQQGKIDSVKTCMDSLILNGYRISKTLYNTVLTQVGE